MTIEEAYKHFLPILSNVKNINAAEELRILLRHVLQVSSKEFSLLNFKSFSLSLLQKLTLEAYIQERITGKPLAYIVNYKYFWQDKFYINENVLIPRPETETLIEELLKLYINKYEHYNILDIGVGSGCLLLSILQEYPNSRGLGIDVSQQACEVTKINITCLEVKGVQKTAIYENKDHEEKSYNNYQKLSQRVNIINVALEDFKTQEKFHIIVSNPPYIDINDLDISLAVKNFEPAIALFAKNNGLYFYELIFKKCRDLLAKNGHLLVEIGHKQRKAIIELAEKYGLYCFKSIKDIANHDRVLIFQQK